MSTACPELNKIVVLSWKVRVFFEAEDWRDMGEAW
jgi:hypothetical protein